MPRVSPNERLKIARFPFFAFYAPCPIGPIERKAAVLRGLRRGKGILSRSLSVLGGSHDAHLRGCWDVSPSDVVPRRFNPRSCRLRGATNLRDDLERRRIVGS